MDNKGLQAKRDYERVYQRKWRKENRDKVREYNKRYWDKKAKKKEEQIRRLLNEGLSIEEIAEEMNITIKSVKFYLDD